MKRLGIATWTLNFEHSTPDDLADGSEITRVISAVQMGSHLVEDLRKYGPKIAGKVLDVKLVFFIRDYNERPHESEYGL